MVGFVMGKFQITNPNPERHYLARCPSKQIQNLKFKIQNKFKNNNYLKLKDKALPPMVIDRKGIGKIRT